MNYKLIALFVIFFLIASAAIFYYFYGYYRRTNIEDGYPIGNNISDSENCCCIEGTTQTFQIWHEAPFNPVSDWIKIDRFITHLQTHFFTFQVSLLVKNYLLK